MWGTGEHFLRDRWPRVAGAVLGLWLMASTIFFPHESSSGFDTLLLGLLVTSNAVQALWAPWFRFWNTAVGLFLLVVEAELPHVSTFRLVNTLATAGAIVALSLIASPARYVDPRQQAVGYRP